MRIQQALRLTKCRRGQPAGWPAYGATPGALTSLLPVKSHLTMLLGYRGMGP